MTLTVPLEVYEAHCLILDKICFAAADSQTCMLMYLHHNHDQPIPMSAVMTIDEDLDSVPRDISLLMEQQLVFAR